MNRCITVLPLRALLPGLRRRPRPRRHRRRTTASTSAATRTACSRASSAATWSRSARPACSPTRRSSSTTRASGTSTSAPSVCVHCGVGCNILPGERYGGLRRILNRYNREVNGYFLCDRGRFGYEFVNRPERPLQPLLRASRGRARRAPTPIAALERFAELLAQGHAARHRLAARLPRVDLRARARGGRRCASAAASRDAEAGLLERQAAILAAGPAASASLEDVRHVRRRAGARRGPHRHRAGARARAAAGGDGGAHREPAARHPALARRGAARVGGHQARAVLHRLAAADAARRRGDALGAARRRRRRRARAGGGASRCGEGDGAARARSSPCRRYRQAGRGDRGGAARARSGRWSSPAPRAAIAVCSTPPPRWRPPAASAPASR